ncbi:MAG: hypothetical protein EAY65_06940 [Alphaproteobacteria bacterium]|nr:MAG: hypothetical protein EAY65_06940 [Alphaproteobacteria bacterium]
MLETHTRKITVELPAHLLESAQSVTGKNLKETISLGLQRIAQEKAYNDMLALEGSYQFTISMETLREDR